MSFEPRLLFYGPEMCEIQSSPVEEKDYRLLPTLRDYMIKTMKIRNGVGLAAPQLGYFKQVVVFEQENGNIVDLVNPEIERLWGKECLGREACLSLPPAGNECPVARMQHVNVSACTVDNPQVRVMFKFSGYEARIVQHETDHLFGTFFIDRAAAIPRNKALKKFYDWKLSQGEKKCFLTTRH